MSKKNNQYTCIMNFKDKNMPSMRQAVESESAAKTRLNIWYKQFAGVSSFAMWTPQGDKICFNSRGDYLFTIPPEACATMGLKP